MRWTMRLEARTGAGEVTISRPVVDGTQADIGLALSETKALSSELQASLVQAQVAEYASRHRIYSHCGRPVHA